MSDFIVKELDTHPTSVSKRFRIGRSDDGRVKIVYEERNALAPHRWRLVASTILNDEDMVGYLDAAGVRV
jgi:hypothetical protein